MDVVVPTWLKEMAGFLVLLNVLSSLTTHFSRGMDDSVMCGEDVCSLYGYSNEELP